MGMDAGVAGFYGILLDKRDEPEIQGILEEIENWIEAEREKNEEDPEADCYWSVDEHEDEIHKIFYPRIHDMLHSVGVTLPEGARLLHTGSDDDRPCRVQTWGDQWGIGFGILMDPWRWPELHQTFRDASEWHTWVWMG